MYLCCVTETMDGVRKISTSDTLYISFVSNSPNNPGRRANNMVRETIFESCLTRKKPFFVRFICNFCTNWLSACGAPIIVGSPPYERTSSKLLLGASYIHIGSFARELGYVKVMGSRSKNGWKTPPFQISYGCFCPFKKSFSVPKYRVTQLWGTRSLVILARFLQIWQESKAEHSSLHLNFPLWAQCIFFLKMEQHT